jgi:hypothetical protein
MDVRSLICSSIISDLLLAIVMLIATAIGDVPDGMHQAKFEIREDTLAFRPVPRQVPTQELDSADSAWINKSRLEQFDRRRWMR